MRQRKQVKADSEITMMVQINDRPKWDLNSDYSLFTRCNDIRGFVKLAASTAQRPSQFEKNANQIISCIQ